ncbi:MAG: PIG-L family deacetylase [Calditrichaeota bacterium]|nr:PIG-L family deacetylase [Calditrichota bacterium]
MRLLLLLLFFSFQVSLLSGQTDLNYNPNEIQAAINKLNVLGSVLYIAAHPDDENQGLLTYMSKGRNYRTAYLSLTRGDGGQNLLGPEKGALFGVIRTQELIAARKIDGARQFFSRAIDFGYSKTAKETLSKWDRETILSDVVKVIRKFKPDIIITRFTEINGGHGHHLSSAILAEEAFHAAADPTRFPEQLEILNTWQAKRIFWNTWQPNKTRPTSASPILSLDLGTYSSLHGMSFREIASKSRSMHKSQGFGSSPPRGVSPDYYELTAGDSANNDLMDGIETSWKRIEGSEDIQNQINKINQKFNLQNPQSIIPDLVNLYKILLQKESSFWIEAKKKEVQNLLQMCSGLWLESIAFDESVTPGKSIKIKSAIINRSAFLVKLNSIKLSYLEKETVNQQLEENKPTTLISTVTIPKDARFTQPYWLENKPGETMFNVNDEFSGQPEGPPKLHAEINLSFNDVKLEFVVPVEYRWNDPEDGEQFKPVVILPDVSLSFNENVFVFKDKKYRQINAVVKAKRDSVSGLLKPEIPKGWEIEPHEFQFELTKKNEQSTFAFKIRPGNNAENGIVKLVATTGDSKFYDEVIEINYPHIPVQTVLQQAETKLVKLAVNVPELKIAYIMGSGDEIPQALQQIGISVELLSDEDLINANYAQYDAVVCGVRAFNTREKLGLYQKRISEYVEKGGTWIVQHNTRFGIQVAQIGPFPFVSRGRDRISEEDAEMDFLKPAHIVFNYPNKIVDSDFDGWVQERGTYLAESWQGKLSPLLAGNDHGEPAKLGSLLYAHHGKGVFIFSALSMFRQLPAGVPGAYRLFVNMISAKQKQELINH